MCWLMLFGIFNAVILLWPGDIFFTMPYWEYCCFHSGGIGQGLIDSGHRSYADLLRQAILEYADDKRTYDKFLVVSAVEKKFVGADTVAKQRIDSCLSCSPTIDPVN